MRGILITVFFTFIYYSTFPQSYFYTYNDSVSCLSLTIQDNKYEMSFSKRIVTIENCSFSHIVTKGKCLRNDSLITLKDDKLGFEFILKKEDNTLYPYQNTPIFLKDKAFSFPTNTTMLQEDLDRLENFEQKYPNENISKTEDLILSSDKIIHGKYSNHDNTTIKIFSDGNYEIEGISFIYSKGKWKENEYSIEFYDSYLNFTFIGKKLTLNRIQLKIPESEKDIFIL